MNLFRDRYETLQKKSPSPKRGDLPTLTAPHRLWSPEKDGVTDLVGDFGTVIIFEDIANKKRCQNHH
jgi:hypothetical protein